MAGIGVARLWDAEPSSRSRASRSCDASADADVGRATESTNAVGGRGEPVVQLEEHVRGPAPCQSARQQLTRQARVEVGQPAPRGQRADVVRERLRVRRRPLRRRYASASARTRRGSRRRAPQPVQVPPLRHACRRVGEGQVVGAEQVDVDVQAVARRASRWPRRRGAPARPRRRPTRAEAQPGQPRPQHVALVPLALRDAEHREQPAVGQRGARPRRSAGRPRRGSRGRRRTARTRRRRRPVRPRGSRAASAGRSTSARPARRRHCASSRMSEATLSQPSASRAYRP